MDLRQLRYYLEIVDQGSITRAANKLGVAQPALSLHLKNMEEELGTALLIRTSKGVQPTAAGTILARRSRTIVDDFTRLKEEIQSLENDPTGTVRIGLPGTISGIVAIPLLNTLRERYPRITLTVAEAMSGFVGEWLKDGQVDIGVLYAPVSEKGLSAVKLVEEELVVISSPGTPLDPVLTLPDLTGNSLILPSRGHGLRDLLDRHASEEGVELAVTVEIDSYANIAKLVASGVGISILPRHAVTAAATSGDLTISRFSYPGFWRKACIVPSPNRAPSRAEEVVISTFISLVQRLIADGSWSAARYIGPIKDSEEAREPERA